MRKKRPDLLKKQWFLLQDNARPHIAAVALAALTETGGTALKHPPYSTDLSPCDFWAFPTLKRQLRGKRFSSGDEVRNATAAVLKGMSQNNLFHVFELFMKCCKKCTQCEGRYFGKEKIVGPVESSDSELKKSVLKLFNQPSYHESQNWIYIDPYSKSQMIKGKIYIVTVMEEHQFLKQSQTRISTLRISNGSNYFHLNSKNVTIR